MGIRRRVKRAIPPMDWRNWSKIPWDEPGFSAQMLKNRLSQAHDRTNRTNTACWRAMTSYSILNADTGDVGGCHD